MVAAGPVPSFVISNLSVFCTSVFTIVVVPLTVILPSIRALPLTCNLKLLSVELVPIPTLLLVESTKKVSVSTSKSPVKVPFTPVKFPLLSITIP